jgi:hypothetical protein
VVAITTLKKPDWAVTKQADAVGQVTSLVACVPGGRFSLVQVAPPSVVATMTAPSRSLS